MKCLLIGGAGDTGKSTTIRRIVRDFLQGKYYDIEHLVDNENIQNIKSKELKEVEEQDKQKIIDDIYADNNDYFCIADSSAKKNDNNDICYNYTKIIISTASDTKKIIDNFKRYYDKYKDDCSFIIAPIRNEESKMKVHFKKKFLLEREYIEIPLARICGNGNYEKNKKWYLDTIFSLTKYVLQKELFNIK